MLDLFNAVARNPLPDAKCELSCFFVVRVAVTDPVYAFYVIDDFGHVRNEAGSGICK